MKAQINFRTGGFYLTEIDKRHSPESLAKRMVSGGFVVCSDNLWGKKRTIIINLSDVESIVLEEEENGNS